jgi:hypothetical protein
MLTNQTNSRLAARLRLARDRGLVALGALVAVGVMILFLTLVGANRANRANSVTPTHASAAHLLLIQPPHPGTANNNPHPNDTSPRSLPPPRGKR